MAEPVVPDTPVVPDVKDWTWVLERPCQECGFVAAEVDPREVADLLRANARRWVEVLGGDPGVLAARSRPGVWSDLEYACHVRDVCRLYDERLELMLTREAPTYPNWDQDATAVEDAYGGQDPAVVSRELAEAAEALATRFDAVRDEQWGRTGHRSDGATFTVESFSRYLLHDPVHHLWDVTGESAGPGHGDHSATNAELFERGRHHIPGGVNSPVRAFRSVGGTPYVVDRGEGARVVDVEGREYVDYVQSYGASILGHAHPVVVEAIREAARRGTTYGAPTRGEVALAEELCARVHGLEQVRLVSSGTEAAMSAIRLARGVTGRDRIVKFEGDYHGHSDALLAGAGSGVAEGALLSGSSPDSAGVTAAAVADTTVLPHNVVPVLDESVAVVCVEPVAANMGLVAPVAGFLEGLRAECDRVGALLLFDEVITGFRLGSGGATAWSGVTPDVWCFGKVIGGGLPVGAFGGSAEAMAHLAPLGDVYQAGTLSGNPLATAAGLAVLGELDAAAYSELESTAASLADGLVKAFASAGVPARFPRVGPLVGVFFGGGPDPVDYATASESVALGMYPAFFHGMLRRGVALAPGPYEVMFPSLAHGPAEIELTVAAAAEVATEMASSDGRGDRRRGDGTGEG